MHNGYNKRFFKSESKSAKKSSAIVFPYILKTLHPESVIDFGCGTGEWLSVARTFPGVKKVIGVDGEYTRESVILSGEEFIAKDLNKKIDINERFDLAVSLEVAEHLKPESAEIFVENLVRHADTILFSAAIPYQGGKYHINEQYPTYWEKLFQKFGYVMCDCLRNIFWNIEGVDVWYKQNIFIICKKELEEKIIKSFHSEQCIRNIVHPEYWEYYRKFQYIFPFSRVKKGERIVIYGASEMGETYIKQINKTKYAEIVCWCDGAGDVYRNKGLKVYNPEKLKELEYDKIVIAVKERDTYNEIIGYLLSEVGGATREGYYLGTSYNTGIGESA